MAAWQMLLGPTPAPIASPVQQATAAANLRALGTENQLRQGQVSAQQQIQAENALKLKAMQEDRQDEATYRNELQKATLANIAGPVATANAPGIPSPTAAAPPAQPTLPTDQPTDYLPGTIGVPVAAATPQPTSTAPTAIPTAPAVSQRATTADKVLDNLVATGAINPRNAVKWRNAEMEQRQTLLKLDDSALSLHLKTAAQVGETLYAALQAPVGSDQRKELIAAAKRQATQNGDDPSRIFPPNLDDPKNQDADNHIASLITQYHYGKEHLDAEKTKRDLANTAIEQQVRGTQLTNEQLRQRQALRNQGVSELQSLDIADPAQRQAWFEQYATPQKDANGKIIAPIIAGVPSADKIDQPFVDRLKKSLIPVQDQPKVALEQLQYDLQKAFLDESSGPDAYDGIVDKLYPPTDAANKQLNDATKDRLNAAITLKDKQEVLKEAYQHVASTYTAVQTAKATEPIKINLAAATQAAQAAASGLTEDDYQRAGQQFAITGEMPNIGRGTFARGKVMHYAQEYARDSGLTPRDLAVAKAAFKGDTKSLENFQKQRDQIVSFEQTAQKNLDLFLDAASKIPDTGVPWINRPLRQLDKNIVGDENIAAVDAARQVANNEIAKVTSGGGLGGVLSDSARKEVGEYNPNNATFKQTMKVAKILRADMANRHTSMDEALTEIKGRIGTPQGTAPAAAPTATPTAGPAATVAPIPLKTGGFLTPHDQKAADAFRRDHPELIKTQ
jgi:hypothetical protein